MGCWVDGDSPKGVSWPGREQGVHGKIITCLYINTSEILCSL